LGYKWSKAYREERKGERGRKCFAFLKRVKQMNSNTNLNSSNQNKCTSMNATKNSYGSLNY
jgi:hypothetical protein